jgi:hypothetical protein
MFDQNRQSMTGGSSGQVLSHMEADGLAKLFGIDQTGTQQSTAKKASFEFLGSSDIDTINWTAVLDSLQVICKAHYYVIIFILIS